MKSALFVLACLGALAAGLFVSSRAVLVWAGPLEETAIGAKTFQCTYFTGAGIITRTYVNDPSGLVGRDTCPRFLAL